MRQWHLHSFWSCVYTESASSLNIRFKNTAYILVMSSSGFIYDPVLELEKEPTALANHWLRLNMGSMVCMFTPELQHCFLSGTRILVFVCCDAEPHFSSLGEETMCLYHLLEPALLFLRHPVRWWLPIISPFLCVLFTCKGPTTTTTTHTEHRFRSSVPA